MTTAITNSRAITKLFFNHRTSHHYQCEASTSAPTAEQAQRPRQAWNNTLHDNFLAQIVFFSMK